MADLASLAVLFLALFFISIVTIRFLFFAPYRIYQSLEQEINTRQARLDATEQSRAQLTLTGIATSFTRRIPIDSDFGGYEDAFFVYATFTNESPGSEETAVAKQVVAHISYHDKKGQQIWTSDVGEWWPGLEPPLLTQVPQKEIESTEFGIGVSHRLSIAFKAKDGRAFGFCCHSHSCRGWRFKKLRLPETEYTVKVTLQGVNVPQTVCTFVLKNPGPGHPFEISGESAN